jgi:hypothetical protein
MQRPYRGPRNVGTELVIFLRCNPAAGGEADNDVTWIGANKIPPAQAPRTGDGPGLLDEKATAKMLLRTAVGGRGEPPSAKLAHLSRRHPIR